MKTVTICVVFYNEQRNLPRLLQSFERVINSSIQTSFSFLFIDNNSEDSSNHVVEKWIEESANRKLVAKLIRRNFNHLGQARQQAIDNCSSDWLVFIDADSELDWNWSSGLNVALKNYYHIAVGVGGNSYYVPEASWHKWAVPISQIFPLGKGRKSGLVDHVPTNNYLLNIKAVKKAGGFRSEFSCVGEDLDLNIRLRQIGKIYYCDGFSVKHFLPRSQWSWFKKMFRYGWAQSVVSIMNKGGVSLLKVLPCLFVIFSAISLLIFPLVTIITLVILLFFSNLRFYFFTIGAYGAGEIIGAFEIGMTCIRLKLKGIESIRGSASKL